MELFHGPDFATGGVVSIPPKAIAGAYDTGRGSFRVRGRFPRRSRPDEATARQGIERLGGGQYQLVVSEIPYMVPEGQADRADRPG
jgi:topoisomerase-4 subunit A